MCGSRRVSLLLLADGALAVEISEAQRREIDEMDWLIEDIQENGVASTVAEGGARPVPDFGGDALRECATD